MGARHAYELVDTYTGNWIGFHQTKQEALEAVIEILDRWGEGAVVNVALGYFPPGRQGKAIAEGPALLAMARAAQNDAGLAAEPTRSRTKARSR